MPMTQADIQQHYRNHWGQVGERFSGGGLDALAYSNPVEDAIMYPLYERLIRDHGVRVNGGRVLDVGCGSGRWVRFFLERFRAAAITGIDFAEASAGLLTQWAATITTDTTLEFRVADIAGAEPPLADRFDLINVGNVLFHIPEPDKFQRALTNIAAMLDENGRAVTTEYLPRVSMRTEWMLVRSRYEFEVACQRAGLEVADIRASSFFANDPMGVDGPDNGPRRHFQAVRAMSKDLLAATANDQSRAYIVNLLAHVEQACLSFCRERVAQIDMPAQKLVVLRRR